MSDNRKWLILGFFVTLLIALPVFLLASKSRQDTHSHASGLTGTTAFSCSGAYADYARCLSDQFQVTLNFDSCPGENSAPNLTESEKDSISKTIYDAFSIPLTYDNYRQEFTATPVTICAGAASDSQGYGPDGALARVPRIGKIVLYPRFFTFHVSESYRKYLIVHESAHVFANSTNGLSLQNALYHLISPGSSVGNLQAPTLDKDCFVPNRSRKYVMKTYARDKVGNGNQESFAESVVNTLYCQSSGNCNPGQGAKIVNFPSTCSNTYNFIRQNVLGTDGAVTIPTDVPDITPEPTSPDGETFPPPTPQATATPGPTSTPGPSPTPEPTLDLAEFNADINGDGNVDLLDWNLIRACSVFTKWRDTQICPEGSDRQETADIDSSGAVDQDDITLWLLKYHSLN